MTAFAPHTLAEALELRAAHPEAIPVAGGVPFPTCLDLQPIPELLGPGLGLGLGQQELMKGRT